MLFGYTICLFYLEFLSRYQLCINNKDVFEYNKNTDFHPHVNYIILNNIHRCKKCDNILEGLAIYLRY